MPFRTISETGEQYGLLSFDKDGKERDNDPDGQAGLFSARLLSETKQHPPSDIFVFSHGWKGDITAAEDQYNRWIKAMLDLPVDRAAMGEKFKPLWIGLHWPSLPFGDEELAADSFDATGEDLSPTAVVETYLERLGLGEDARPLLETIVEANRRNAAALSLPSEAATAYRKLAVLAGRKAGGPSGPPDEDGAPFDPDKAFDAGNSASIGTDFGSGGGFLGGILGPLRQLSYWTMKKRARSIGESGMHLFIAQLMNAAPVAKIHLMGHSFGCIVIASILGGPGAKEPLPRPVDSVALVQGAVSLWAFADTIPMAHGTGYFNPLFHHDAVRGPFLVTHSIHDRAVGILYPLACAAAFAEPSFGDSDLPKYGGIGTFGVCGFGKVVKQPMLMETEPYHFQAGKIHNLESSKFIAKGGGVSGAHSDIAGPQVAHAIWQAAAVSSKTGTTMNTGGAV